MVVVGVLLWICGCFTLAFLGALLEHKRSWGMLAALFLLILAASTII
jgi:hypothetical protein